MIEMLSFGVCWGLSVINRPIHRGGWGQVLQLFVGMLLVKR